MRGPGGPAGLQNRFAAVRRPWRFDSPAFRFLVVSNQLSVFSKNRAGATIVSMAYRKQAPVRLE